MKSQTCSPSDDMPRRSTFRLTCALAVGLVACVSAPGAPSVGVLLKGKAPFWAAVEKGALLAAGELGVELSVQAPERDSDAAAQIELLNALVDAGVAALVIAPASRDALVEPLAAAMGRGVKVVVIDTTLASGRMPVFIGTDQRQAGRDAGNLLARLVGPRDVVTFLKHNQVRGATTERELGALEALRSKHPDIVVHGDIYSGLEPGQELIQAAALFDKHPETRAVLASGTPGTMAMLKVLEEKGLADTVHFVGFGFNLNPTIAAAIDNGHLDGWVAQLPSKMGYLGVKAAVTLHEGRTLPAVINTEIIVVTRSNLHTPEVQALLDI
jgi:ribose transport system substrate-binding protein